MHSIIPEPNFIVYGGDLAAHGGTRENTITSVTQVIQGTRATFPGVPILFTLGNNDCYPRYVVNSSFAEWLPTLGNLLSDIFPDQTTKDTFIKFGYYAYAISPHLTILSLNTILYSPSYAAYPSNDTKQTDSFNWLVAQLDQAKLTSTKIYIIGHIPPSSIEYEDEVQWHPEYIEAYFKLVSMYPSTILGQFFAHTHRDDFKIYDEPGQQPMSILICPSISPNSYTNPAWRVYFANSTSHQLMDYIEYYADFLAPRADKLVWEFEYDFDAAYNQTGVSTSSLQDLFRKLRQDPQLFFMWRGRYESQFSKERYKFLCAMAHPVRADYLRCIDTPNKP